MAHSRQTLRRHLEALAFNQAGYFTASQARDVGYSYQAQKYHVDVGNWIRVDRGLFRLPAWPSRSDDQYVMWTLWSGGKGVVSHESALQVYELSDVDPVAVHLTIPPGFRAVDPMVVTHVATLASADTEAHEGWSVTTALRTLADVAAGDLSQEHIDQALTDALDKGLVTRRSLLRRTAELPERPALRLERALVRREEANGH